RTVLPGAPPLCLLARVGDETMPVALGSAKTLVPRRGGRLFVQANTLDCQACSGHVLLEIRGGNPATEAATVPGPTRGEAAEVALQTLLARPANSPTDREGLRRGLADFCCNFAGTPQAVRAAGLCRQFRSLLDKLDPQQIPRDERFPWQPKELVAVLGEHR